MKKLALFNFWSTPTVTGISENSNSWYIRNYESYFDEVNFLVLSGDKLPPVSYGRSKFIYLGKGNRKLNLFLSPFRLYQFIKKTKATHIITYEQTFLWWMGLFVRIFLRKKIYLLPQAYPEEIYKLTGKSLSYRYPIWFERILLNLSYRLCSNLLTAKGTGDFVNAMKRNKILNKKLLIADSLPEIVIFPSFVKSLKEINKKFEVKKKDKEPYIIISVNRLIKEKKIDHLIKAVKILEENGINVELKLIGSGAEQKNLEKLARESGVEKKVAFLGFINNGELPVHLLEADLFLSPLSGSTFREAAICGMPIIAYNIDWLRDYLEHKEYIYRVDTVDHLQFADGIMELLGDVELRKKLSANIQKFAQITWSPDSVGASLKKVME